MRFRPATRILLSLACFAVPAGLAAQRARPAVCGVVAAGMRVVAGGRPESETADTARIQQALGQCPPGEAVELSSARGLHAFVSGPLALPAGVTLWIDAGVTVYASRVGGDYRGPDGVRLPLVQADAGSALGGFGVVDGRAGAVLLDPDEVRTRRWADFPQAERPALVRASGEFYAGGVTLQGYPGVALRGDGPLVLEGVEVVGDPTLPGVAAVRMDGSASSLQVTGSTLAGSEYALDVEPETSIALSATTILSGAIRGMSLSAPCVADSSPALACVPSGPPAVLTRLVQTGAREAAALLTVADTRLPDAAGRVDLLEGETVVASAEVSSAAAVFDLSGLRAGLHRFQARAQTGGARFGDLTMELTGPGREAVPATMTLTSSATTFPYGTAVVLTATLAGGDGVATLLDGAVPLGQVTLRNGMGSLTISTLALGPHVVTATYPGDGVNVAQTSPALILQVNPVTTIVSLGAMPASIPYGAVLTITGNVLPVTASGMLTFRDGGKVLGQAALLNGTATMSVANLAPGSHSVTAFYAGDAYDLAATSSVQNVLVTELSTATALFATPATTTYGHAVQVDIAVTPADVSGTVVVQDGSSVVATLVLAGGLAGTQLTTLAPGLHLLTASYGGDASHTASASSSFAVSVGRTPSTTVLASLPATVAAGTAVLLTAHVSPANASGVVTFFDRNSGALGQAGLAGGMASVSLASLPAGSHSIVASYAGDTNDGPSDSAPVTTVVPLAAATLVLSGVPASLPYAAPATLIATVTPASASGSVTLSDSAGGAPGTMLLSGGGGSVTLPALEPGVHVLQATYGGDASFGPAVANLGLTVTPDVTSTSLAAAQNAVTAESPVLLNVEVAAPYLHSPGGVVNVLVRSAGGVSTSYPATLQHTLAGAGFVTLALDSGALGLGSFSATASYAGDRYDQPSASSAVGFSVIPIPTRLLLTLPANPIATGTVSSMTATVGSGLPAAPGGTMSFFRDGSLVATMPVVNGSATASLPGLPIGTYSLTVSYAPSGLFGPSVAAAQVLVVTLPVRISLTPSSVQMKAGTDATATLAITPVSGYGGTFTESCASASAYVTCSVDPAKGPGATTTAVRLHASATTYAQRESPVPGGWLAVLLPAVLLGRGRRRSGERWPKRAMLLCSAVFLLIGCAGCGKGDFFNIPPGSYPVTVSVMASGSTVSAPLDVEITQ